MVKNSGLLNIKNKSESLKKDVILYNSTFDYEKFELNDLKNELIKSEEKIFTNLSTIGKATFEIAEELYKVNQKLANHKGGTYMTWCTSLGINKDKSSVLLKKYNLYLETNKKEIMELPIPVVKTLTNKKNNFTTDEVLTIIESKNPSMELKEIENQYSQVANTENYEIEDAEIIHKVTPLLNEIEKNSLLAEKKELKKRMSELTKEINNIKNKIFNIDQKLENSKN